MSFSLASRSVHIPHEALDILSPTSPVKRPTNVRLIVAASTALSVGAFLYFSHLGMIATYKDVVSHLEIARRIIDSPTPGLGQLGGIWLPLPHLLILPLVWFDPLYFSGAAGSFLSMVGYIVTSVLVYKIARDLTGRERAGIVAASVFMLNPNVLFMQSTAMTELPLFALMAGMVYGTQRWVRTEEPGPLMAAGVASLLATLTRYESWIALAALTLVVIVVCWRKGFSMRRTEGTALGFLYFAGFGVAAWLLWNQLIFGNALNFQFGEYSKPSLWVHEGELAVGNWWMATQTYAYSVLNNVWSIFALLAVVGLVALTIKERLAPVTLPLLSLLRLFPFFVTALALGQRPLYVMQLSGESYNVRFGLLMILPTAVLVGYLTTLIRPRRMAMAFSASVLGLAIAFGAVGLFTPDRIATASGIEVVSADDIADANYFAHAAGASDYLSDNYDGGTILSRSFGNERVLFDARISPERTIYEGSDQKWNPALEDPAGHGIEWVVMRHGDQPDDVYTALSRNGRLDGYDLAYQNDAYQIYKELP